MAFRLVPALPLRRRYILTRAGGLRLRYVAATALMLSLFTGPHAAAYIHRSVETVSAPGPAVTELAAAPPVAASPDGEADPALLAARARSRMNRYQEQPSLPAAGSPAEEETIVARLQRQIREVTVEFGRGDTLAGVLQKAGLSSRDAYHTVGALEEYYDPRHIRPGQKIWLRFDPAADDGYDFTQMKMDLDTLRTVRLERDVAGAITAEVDEKSTVRRTYGQKAEIELSLYGSALKAGIPATVVAAAIKAFSWDVDFQRDIRQGDALEVMYDRIETEDGEAVAAGDILYARLNVNGHDIPLYRYETTAGDVDYFTPDGKSIRKALMTTPVDGARLSSGFGQRKHPVLGYTKMHKGVDFAAPTGTPIYAAGDGVIEQIGKWSSYGNYIRIRHNSSLKTAYAHMSKFGKGLAAGSRVKQGQIIGYIGTTGRSTGPHLHYEVLQNGNQVNPRAVKTAQGETLKGNELAAFKAHVAQTDRTYAALAGRFRVASLEKTSAGSLSR